MDLILDDVFEQYARERESLIAEIEKAFSKTLYLKYIGDPIELGELHDKRWEELTTEDVIQHYYVYFFSPEGFHYFLPAYLIHILKDPGQLDESFVPKTLLKHLAQDYDSPVHPHLRKLFTPQQIDLLHDFLELYQKLFLPDDILQRRLAQLEPKHQGKLKYHIRKQIDELHTLLFKVTKYWMGN